MDWFNSRNILINNPTYTWNYWQVEYLAIRSKNPIGKISNRVLYSKKSMLTA